MNLLNHEFIKSCTKLKDKNGRSFGYIQLNGYKVFLDHWKYQKKYYTQWKVMETGNVLRYIGTANVTGEPINVQKANRNKTFKRSDNAVISRD